MPTDALRHSRTCATGWKTKKKSPEWLNFLWTDCQGDSSVGKRRTSEAYEDVCRQIVIFWQGAMLPRPSVLSDKYNDQLLTQVSEPPCWYAKRLA